MAGTKEGALKAAATNKAKYGEDFYKIMGQKGGKNGHTGGFAANRKLARIAGSKGGQVSRRRPMERDALGNAITKAGNRVNYPSTRKNKKQHKFSILNWGRKK